MPSEILSLEEAVGFNGCVLTYGHFTIIHPGHIRYLKHAKGQGEFLLVALIGDSDDSNAPKYQFSQKERAEALALLDIANAVVLLKGNELSSAIDKLDPSLLVLGKEFETNQEKEVKDSIELVKRKSINVQFHAGEINYGNADLLIKTERELKQQRQKEFKSACKRQNLKLDNLLALMDDWNETKLIVVGDTILDQYATCEAIGMSAEAPVLVVKELDKCNYIGGAAIVASHIRALGANCEFISVVGNDSIADLVKNKLDERDIVNSLIVDGSRPTTFKKRYVVENQKLFRVSRLEDHSLESFVEDNVIKQIEESAKDATGIVVSDFVYGVVTDKVLNAIHKVADKYKLMLFGDLQCSSQVGDVTRFNDFSLLCPNEREARIALKEKDAGLGLLSKKLLEKTRCERLILKLGAEGFIAYDRSQTGEVLGQAFPALSVNPLDVTGAGDSLLAVMATGLASGHPMMETTALACCMAGLAVETMGNSPITSNALRESLLEILNV